MQLAGMYRHPRNAHSVLVSVHYHAAARIKEKREAEASRS